MKITKTENRSGTLRHGRTKRDASTSCGNTSQSIADYTVILAGKDQQTRSDYSFVGTGGGNAAIGIYSTVLNGSINSTNECYAFIGSGSGHYIAPGGCYGSILNGTNNKVSGGAFGTILGGAGNTVSHAYAGIFGKNLVSCSDDTFHVSCLNAVHTPLYGTQPAGSIVYKPLNSITTSDRVLVIIP